MNPREALQGAVEAIVMGLGNESPMQIHDPFTHVRPLVRAAMRRTKDRADRAQLGHLLRTMERTQVKVERAQGQVQPVRAPSKEDDG